jgi:hypothetical protein
VAALVLLKTLLHSIRINQTQLGKDGVAQQHFDRFGLTRSPVAVYGPSDLASCEE